MQTRLFTLLLFGLLLWTPTSAEELMVLEGEKAYDFTILTDRRVIVGGKIAMIEEKDSGVFLVVEGDSFAFFVPNESTKLIEDWNPEDYLQKRIFAHDVLRISTTTKKPVMLLDSLDQIQDTMEKAAKVAISEAKLQNYKAIAPEEYQKHVAPRLATFSQAPASPSSAPNDTLPRKVASINALLVSPINHGRRFAASTAKLIVSVTPNHNESSGISTGFNQEVGDDMRSALNEVVRAMSVRYTNWPKHLEMTFGFEDKYTGKDGPSAAVAIALLIESLHEKDFEIARDFAVTGDMNADLHTAPVGGVDAKIRAAINAKCSFVLIPVANKDALSDMAVDGQWESIAAIQVISIDHFNEAVQVASKNRSQEVSDAAATFDKVRDEIEKKGLSAVRKPENVAALKGIMESMPNHLSAGLLLRGAKGDLPKTYSLNGSFVRFQEAMEPFESALAKYEAKRRRTSRYSSNKPNPPKLRDLVSEEIVTDTLKRLGALKGKLDPLLKDMNAASLALVKALNERMRFAGERDPRKQWAEEDLIKAQDKIIDARDRLMESEELFDRLMAE